MLIGILFLAMILGGLAAGAALLSGAPVMTAILVYAGVGSLALPGLALGFALLCALRRQFGAPVPWAGTGPASRS